MLVLIGAIRDLGPDRLGFNKPFTILSLMQKYSEMAPEIFGVWHRFKPNNVEDSAQEALSEALPHRFLEEYAETKEFWMQHSKGDLHLDPLDFFGASFAEFRNIGDRLRKDRQFRLRTQTLESFFGNIRILADESMRQRWDKALQQDPELAKWYVSRLEDEGRALEQKKADIERMIKKLSETIQLWKESLSQNN